MSPAIRAKGVANLPESWQTGNAFFGYRWNCSGGAVQVQRHGSGIDVRFVGNASTLALVTPIASQAAGVAVTRNPDGSFHVETAGDAPDASFPSRPSFQFVLVLV